MSKLLFCLLFALVLSPAFGQNIQYKQAEGSIRVMSYNIRNAKGMDNVTDYKRIANVINSISPDVVALQEIDSITSRSKKVDVLSTIAKISDMHSVYGAAIDYDGGKYGIGILSKEKPLSVKRIALPGREERRSLLLVEFADYVFCCTHFSLNDDDRLSSIDIIDKQASEYNKPVLLAGDINATPDSKEIQAFKKNWTILNDTTQHTFPSNKPSETIDYILARINKKQYFNVLQSAVLNEPIASDHRPVFVDVKLQNQ